MTKILSDEQIRRQIERLRTYAAHNPSAIITEIADELQAAVLEAQSKQKPVAIVGLQHQTDMLWGAKVIPAGEPQKFAQFLKDMPVGTPLYAAPVVQPGMVMVPREPTEEMLLAAGSIAFMDELAEDYRRLIAAAEGKK